MHLGEIGESGHRVLGESGGDRCQIGGSERVLHRLDQIAADGSQKLPVRILPVLRKERSAGRLPQGATLVLAAWVCHLRGMGAPVNDARAEAVVPLAAGQLTDAVRRVLGTLDPTIAADKEVVGAVLAHCEQLEHQGRP